MKDQELIQRILADTGLKIGTRTFVEGIRNELNKHGALTENQLKVLKSVCRERGISFEESTKEDFFAQESQLDSDKMVSDYLKNQTCGRCIEGLVLVRARENNNEYVFVCCCRVGQKRLEKFPVWNDKLIHDYFTEDVL